jgi:hypothetical protein
MALFKILFWIAAIVLLKDIILYNSLWVFLGNILVFILNIGILRSLYYKPKAIDGSSLLAKKIAEMKFSQELTKKAISYKKF